MNAPTVKKVLVESGQLRAAVAALFEAVGASAEHAEQIAEVVVFADLRGVESHGVQFTPRYLRGIARGHLNPTPALRVPCRHGRRGHAVSGSSAAWLRSARGPRPLRQRSAAPSNRAASRS